ncbi:hypothetical protein QVD99_003409 [Batrachochytrium dendrobatidis]|nr:hypothetical protein QVD99_003409 [Batrachochytrium dendrobatidis]
METNPIFHSRYPLGKDYPGFKKPALPTKLGGRDSRKPSNSVAQLQQRLHTLAGQIPIAKNMSAGKTTHSSPYAPHGDKSVQNEYIRNLQQQIYLLELETRYLKSGGQHSLDMHGHDFMARNSHPHSQNTTETGLDIKELQSEFNAFKEKTRELELTLESVTKQYDEQTEEIAKLKDRHGIEKDKIYGELISIRKKYETATSECKRSELSYKRIVQENEQLERIASKSKEQENSTREKIDEQLQINKSLSNKVDELLQVNVTITAKLKKSESVILGFKMEEHQSKIREFENLVKELETKVKQHEYEMTRVDLCKKKMDDDLKDLLSKNIALTYKCEESKKALDRERKQETEQSQSDKKEIEDIEKQKYQLERLKGDYEMLKITMENKDRKISELQQQMELLETSNHKILETKNVLSEQILEMETRLHKNEIELTQVCQDKRLLTDDVAEIKIQLETVLARLSTATSKNNSLVIQIEKYKRDLDTLQKFASVLDQVETNGQNYLQLMRDMRKYLNTNE